MLGVFDIKDYLLGSDLGLIESDIDILYIDERVNIPYWLLKVSIARGGREYSFEFSTSLDRLENRMGEEDLYLMDQLGIEVEVLFSTECVFKNREGARIQCRPYQLVSVDQLENWIGEVLAEEGKLDKYTALRKRWGTFYRSISPIGILLYADFIYESKLDSKN